MRYKFKGQPDERFPDLVSEQYYHLHVGCNPNSAAPYITYPIYCRYANWETFYDNWWPEPLATAIEKAGHCNCRPSWVRPGFGDMGG